MSTSLVYFRTAERPDLRFWVLDDDGVLIDFSTGYTLAWRLGVPGSAATFEKTTGITGAAGDGVEPSGDANVTLTFGADELDDVTAGLYVWQLHATTTTLDRVFEGTILIKDVIGAAPTP
jgi:hypothetical protein